jgi:hypothetical protein
MGRAVSRDIFGMEESPMRVAIRRVRTPRWPPFQKVTGGSDGFFADAGFPPLSSTVWLAGCFAQQRSCARLPVGTPSTGTRLKTGLFSPSEGPFFVQSAVYTPSEGHFGHRRIWAKMGLWDGVDQPLSATPPGSTPSEGDGNPSPKKGSTRPSIPVASGAVWAA